ncbi:site-specific integrase [Streptomyces atratus]|uniref:hypothetical protein n=1 Tax=Streptomyces atratus TaxID=1893 RepID=UPI003658AE67
MVTGPRGGRISTAVLRDATHWDDVATKLGYEHLRRHDIRRTGLTRFADAGVQVHVLRKITAAGAALSAYLSTLRAPRSLPSTIAAARRHGQGS